VQVSTAYDQQKDGSKVITRSKYVEIKSEKPDTPEKDLCETAVVARVESLRLAASAEQL